MNQSAEESLMALLEAMLTLAAGAEARRQPPKPTVTPGGYPEEQFLDLTDEERDELTCNICYQILKEAMQCTNNHKFCHSCLVVWSTTGEYANRVTCPVCRTRGIYFRNDDIDTKVGDKKIKCHMDSCTWTGLVRYLPTHRHNTYDDNDENKEPEEGPSFPRLEQVGAIAPPVSTARFVGTGLTTRSNRLNGVGESVVSSTSTTTSTTPRTSLLPGRSPSTNSTASVSTNTSQETVIDIGPGRGRGRGRRGSNTNTVGTNTTTNSQTRRVVPPVRAAGNNRITFAHSRSNAENNNPNINRSEGLVSNGVRSSLSRASASSTAESVDNLPNSIAGGFVPRPPSAPRTNGNPTPRRLPRILNPLNPNQQTMGGEGSQAATTTVPSSNSETLSRNSNSQQDSQSQNGVGIGNIRHHLQDSRNRLNNLMSSFTSELDRNRLEMMQFQQERETQRREQLEEVRQLSQRLGQVAFELRRLLEHRRRMPSFSDSDSDENVFGND